MTPVPLKEAFSGLSAALSVMLTLALRLPVVPGVKVTLIVHDVLIASEPGQLLVCAKSLALVPVMLMVPMLSAAVPLLVSVTVFVALVELTFWLPKLRLVGFKFTTGAGALWAVPLSATFCGVP